MDFEMMDTLLMEQPEGFTIETGAQAEWAARKVSARYKERDRLLGDIDVMLTHYKELRDREIAKADADCSFLLAKLEAYMTAQPDIHKTKTTEYVRIPSGKLVRKRGGYEYKRDDNALCDYLRVNAPDLITITEKPNWAELKKHTVTVSDGSVIHADTGELITGVTAVRKPDTFEFKED